MTKKLILIILTIVSSKVYSQVPEYKKKPALIESIKNNIPTRTERIITPVVLGFSEAYMYKCMKDCCMCGRTFTEEESNNYKLEVDEGKGEAWATDKGNGIVEFTYDIKDNFLSEEFFNKMVVQKQMKFDANSSISQDLLNTTFTNAGIKNIPTEKEMTVNKGLYNVVVDKDVSTTYNNNIEVVLKVILNQKTKETKFEARVKNKPKSSAFIHTPVGCSIYEAWFFYKCTGGSGLCGTQIMDNGNSLNYGINPNTGRGEAWANDLGNGKTEFTYYLRDVNLSSEYFENIIVKKQFKFENPCSLSQALINKTFKDAGIKTIPKETDIVIEKGVYPVKVDKKVSTKMNNNIILVFRMIYDSKNKKTSFNAEVLNKD